MLVAPEKGHWSTWSTRFPNLFMHTAAPGMKVKSWKLFKKQWTMWTSWTKPAFIALAAVRVPLTARGPHGPAGHPSHQG